jgi:hypothetical protein
MKGKSSLTAQSWAMKQQSISYHGDAGTPIKTAHFVARNANVEAD